MTQSVAQAATKLLAHTNKVIRGTLLGSASRIIEDTPVDTGLLRSNWQATVGSPANGEVGNRSESVSKAQASAKALSVNLGDVFYLTNNVNYAIFQELERGMMRRELARLSAKLGS